MNFGRTKISEELSVIHPLPTHLPGATSESLPLVLLSQKAAAVRTVLSLVVEGLKAKPWDLLKTACWTNDGTSLTH